MAQGIILIQRYRRNYFLVLPSDFDCIVVGGGPAGAIAARRLARAQVSVALVEATPFDSPRYGGTLPPEINPLLKLDGLWESFLATNPQPSPGVVSAWGSAQTDEQDFIRNSHGNGWHVDRLAFDRMLVEAATRAGCAVLQGLRVESCARTAEGAWGMQVCAKGRRLELRSRLVIDASGRRGFRCSWQGGRDVQDALIAMILELRGTPPAADMRMYIESAPVGWWYSAPMHGGIVCMLFTDGATYRHGSLDPLAQVHAAPLTAGRVAGLRLATTRVLTAQSALAQCTAGEGWLAVGERAASYDPISGRGVFNALRDGAACGEAALACLQGHSGEATAYGDRLRREFETYAAERRRFYASERRWHSQPFWRNRL
jgi:flavin-dependent dehydrogenase